MTFLSSTSLRTRVLTGFGLTMAVMMLAAALGLMRVATLSDRLESLVANEVRALDLARRWAGLTEANIQRRMVQMVVEDKAFVEAFTSKSKVVSATIEQLQKEVDLLSQSERSNALHEQVMNTRKQYQALRDSLYKQTAAGEDGKVRIVKELIPVMNQYLEALGAYADNMQAELRNAVDQATQEARHARNLTLAILLAAIACGAVIAIVITRSVTEPVSAAQEVAQRIATGDLSGQLQVQGQDELARLQQALSDMQGQLRLTMADVRTAAEQVQTSSSEIASGSLDLSNRTEQAASSLEQTGAALQQLTQTVNDNAGASRQADQLAASAAGVAQQGGAMVQRVVETMSDIQRASGKIGDIIGVIDGIAFQTNILALNAAVEAARAGEQGRGFAVVAAEVRSLAGRSAQAAKEIKTLISETIAQVERGSDLVSQAGSKITEVVGSVERVTTVISGIAGQSGSQATTLNEIGQAVQQLDQMTQQNAALVEQSAASAESLREQAGRLLSTVSQFRLG
ncbi:methyl-accepting chemotaxis protein [Paucibacter oligotrophus]|uniref:Methyl-accepting chemotaxis protein n=1 Tax=Roseateles oligotrophus TaxID=1769250 RepID=A0A840LB71_9BURK|nr:methyl-accepting chemotaxis protein [Roseateles oligotrophus]MBB4845834.1 methyl-accepting chemotaxis protein [Roseateles oligotrophus]